MNHAFDCGTGRALVWAAAAVLSTAAYGHSFSHGDLVLDHPYAAPSLAGTSNGAAWLRSIQNEGSQPERLLSASSPVAARVELHRMTLDAGVMRMREVPAIELPPHSLTPLEPRGPYHLMLVDLKQPLKEGERFELTLNFERAGRQSVQVWVQAPRPPAHGEHKH